MSDKQVFGWAVAVAAIGALSLLMAGMPAYTAILFAVLGTAACAALFSLYMLVRVKWWFRHVVEFDRARAELCHALIDDGLPWRDYFGHVEPDCDDVERYFWRWDFDSFARNRELYEDVLHFRDTGELPDRFAKAA